MVETKDAERRTLRFDQMNDILADAERLDRAVRLRTTGNWSAAQIVQHIADGIDRSINGYGVRGPDDARAAALAKRDALLQKGFPLGLRLPDGMQHFLPPPDNTWPSAMKLLREAVSRTASDPMKADHPFFGEMSHEQWVQFHCRHAEMHFSFMHPA